MVIWWDGMQGKLPVWYGQVTNYRPYQGSQLSEVLGKIVLVLVGEKK